LEEKELQIKSLSEKVANLTEELKEMDKQISLARQNEGLIEKYKKEAEANQTARKVAEQ
jgi:hypothetical protein